MHFFKECDFSLLFLRPLSFDGKTNRPTNQHLTFCVFLKYIKVTLRSEGKRRAKQTDCISRWNQKINNAITHSSAVTCPELKRGQCRNMQQRAELITPPGSIINLFVSGGTFLPRCCAAQTPWRILPLHHWLLGVDLWINVIKKAPLVPPLCSRDWWVGWGVSFRAQHWWVWTKVPSWM